MTENDAREWIADRFGQEAVEKLATLANEVTDETTRQNLIAPSTVGKIWVRHVLDSAQLVPLAPAKGLWVDIGTGAGFPGLVVAILRAEPTYLVEPRRQRVAFLARCVDKLNLTNVAIHPVRVETMAFSAAVISARAVAPVEKLLHEAAACGTTATRWLLPRGRSGVSDVGRLRKKWGGMFHMKQSLTDPQSVILICDGPVRK